MGEPPAWLVEEHALFQAARWLGVAPWELANMPKWWLDRALFHRSVESGAQNIKVEKHDYRSQTPDTSRR